MKTIYILFTKHNFRPIEVFEDLLTAKERLNFKNELIESLNIDLKYILITVEVPIYN